MRNKNPQKLDTKRAQSCNMAHSSFVNGSIQQFLGNEKSQYLRRLSDTPAVRSVSKFGPHLDTGL